LYDYSKPEYKAQIENLEAEENLETRGEEGTGEDRRGQETISVVSSGSSAMTQ
jgi:hypothetical protein